MASRSRVFLDISVGTEPIGRLTIELFTDKTPKTCENFRQLCTGEHKGLSYARSPLHRVIDEFMVQGGDITKGDGTGGESIYGEEFEDESLKWRDMDAAGLVCSANRGWDTNGSQFFITLDECPHLNGKHTIFGHLVSGHQTLQRIAKTQVDRNDRPLEPVLVARCGELERKKKTTAMAEALVNSDSGDRGRRRDSNMTDDGVRGTPPPQRPGKNRRQSDNVVDEGLRGRPRARSNSGTESRSRSKAIDDEESPATKHKRKRSQSPSRHISAKVQSRSTSAERRRRRSLPNQYYRDNDGRERKHRDSPRRDDPRHADGRLNDGGHARRNDYAQRGSRNSNRGYGNFGRLDRNDGRLGGGEDGDENAPVKYKGRGIMRY